MSRTVVKGDRRVRTGNYAIREAGLAAKREFEKAEGIIAYLVKRAPDSP